MTARYDVIVLGAGPAGAGAATQAARLGLRTLVCDEGQAAGGQVYRVAPGIHSRHQEAEHAPGDALRHALANSAVDARFEYRVWHVERSSDGFVVHAVTPAGAVTLSAAALIVANGAQERYLPIAGWERPGVLSLAGATVLLKAQRMLPGRDVVVAGAGPLLFAVAAGIVNGGGRVAAVIDATPRRAWLRELGSLATRPDLLARGAGWLRLLITHRVPLLHAHALRSIEGDRCVTRVKVGALGADGAFANSEPRTIACDCVCLGFGLVPATDVTRLLGAAHAFDPARGGWHPVTDDDQVTSVSRLYVCGDAAGVSGAAAAPWSGHVAALSAARDLGCIDAADATRQAREPRRARDRAARFGAAMMRLARGNDGLVEQMAADTLVCQCERLSRASLDRAIDDGCMTLSELKSATRCGMGPCGGRLCEDAAARLIGVRTGRSREEIGLATGRPPLRPVDLDALAGEFDYDTLPIAQPAPL